MRLNLSNLLRTRPGNYTKDARLVNAYPDAKGGEVVARKRAGINAAVATLATPGQGVSGIASLTSALPFNGYADVSKLLFSVTNDSYDFTVMP